MDRYPSKEIKNEQGLAPGILVSRRKGTSSAFFKHPYDGLPGCALAPDAKVFLYIKTVEYQHDLEDDNPKDYHFDVVLWEDRLIEISVGRLQKFAPKQQ